MFFSRCSYYFPSNSNFTKEKEYINIHGHISYIIIYVYTYLYTFLNKKFLPD